MSFWSQMMDWLGVGGQPAQGFDETEGSSSATAVLDEPVETAIPDDAVEAAEPSWWCPPGPLTITTPEAPKPERIDLSDTPEHAVLVRLEAALNDPELDLPHLPHIPQQVLALLRQDRAGMDQVAQLISQDQVLAAALLRRANSAAFAGTVKVTALQAALSRLGTRGIRAMVVGESLKHLTVSLAGGRTRGAMLWRESLAAGYTMAAFADVLGLTHAEPFLLGLLHDIGKIVVLRACGDVERAAGAAIEPAAFDYLCQEFHEMMGEMLAEHWRLPEDLGRIIRRHHSPLEPADQDAPVRAAVQLVDATVALLGYGPSVAYDLLATPAAVFLRAGDNPAFMQLLESLPEAIHSTMSESLDKTG